MKFAACILPLLSRARLAGAARAAAERVAAAERDAGRLRARAPSWAAGPAAADAAEIGGEHRALQANMCAVEGTACGYADTEVRVMTGDHPDDIDCVLWDSNGVEEFAWSGIGMEAHTEYTFRLPLYPDEYTFEITDWLGDGLSGYEIRNMLTGNILVEGGEHDDFVTEAFTVYQDYYDCCEDDGPCQVSIDSQVGWCGCIPQGEICEQGGPLCCDGFSCNPIADGQVYICQTVEQQEEMDMSDVPTFLTSDVPTPSSTPISTDVPTPPPGGAGGVRCAYTGDDIVANCPSGQFCELPAGECLRNRAFWRGTCSPVRSACPSVERHVCGCDSTTYVSACAAHALPMNVADANGACVSPAPTPPPN